MAEDLMDYWVRLIKPIFPTNAWIVSHFSDNDHIIQIDWNLENNTKRLNKRSKKIQIVIKEDAIDQFLEKNKQDRELYGDALKLFIGERYNHFNPDNDALTNRSVRTEKWLVSKDILNTLTSSHSLMELFKI
jgi:intracellular sulfur oxidation DsrE/DsrF family protein